MWYSEMVLVFRHIIDDMDEPYKYTDVRIMKLLLTAAVLAKGENVFNYDYTVNVQSGTITPDPSEMKDDAFINLVILKAACLFFSSSLGKIGGGLSVSEGPYKFNNTSKADSKKFITANWCKKYENEKIEYAWNRNMVPGLAIIGPYRSNISRSIYNNRCEDGRIF